MRQQYIHVLTEGRKDERAAWLVGCCFQHQANRERGGLLAEKNATGLWYRCLSCCLLSCCYHYWTTNSRQNEENPSTHYLTTKGATVGFPRGRRRKAVKPVPSSDQSQIKGSSTEVCVFVCGSFSSILSTLLSTKLPPLLALLWDIDGLLLSVQEAGCSCCIHSLESKASLKKKKASKERGEKKKSSQCLQCAAFLFVQIRILQTAFVSEEYTWKIRLRNRNHRSKQKQRVSDIWDC